MQQHDEAIARYLERAARRPEVLGVLLTGSVASGTERPDSDVDLVRVVDDATWTEAVATRRIMVVEHDGADYPGGYFDVKLATLEQLHAAADRGDDPVRHSLGGARVLHDQGFDLVELVARIGAPPPVRRRRLIESSLAQARLHGRYFLAHGLDHAEPFLAAHAAVHLALAAGRVAIASAGALHPGPKDLVATLRALPDPAPAVADAVQRVTALPDAGTARELLALIESIAGDALPDADTLSRFVTDNELAWFTGTVPPEHW
jgi:hypothetical protein